MNLQLFIHRNYETIKLVLLIIIAAAAFTLLYNQGQQAQSAVEIAKQESITREENVAKLLEADQKNIKDIKDNQEKQTKLIICLLAAHGANVVITPDDEAECRMLVDEAVEESHEPRR